MIPFTQRKLQTNIKLLQHQNVQAQHGGVDEFNSAGPESSYRHAQKRRKKNLTQQQ